MPLWVDISELWPEAYVHSGVLRRTHPLVYVLQGLANFLFKKGKLVTVINSNTKEFIVRKRGVESDRVQVFVPGFDCGESPRCCPRAPRTPDQPFRVTYAGSLGELYPLEELIKAVFNLRSVKRNVEIRIVGEGTKKSGLENLVEEIGLVGAVEFLPPVPKAELWRIFSETDLLIVIEKDVRYGFPSKLLDYFSAGRPILIASEADYRLPDEIFIKCAPKQEELAKVLGELMDMSFDSIAKLGVATFSYARDRFTTQAQYMSLIKPHLEALCSKV
jgi:glycosyltransferase involved in cell wall biosynthesis